MSVAFRPFAVEPFPDEVLRRIAYWAPPGSAEPGWPRRQPRTGLRIATITGERLWHGFRHEAHVFPLTPGNWQAVLRHGGIDLLLVESCWETVTGHWYLAQSGHGRESALLKELLETARAAGVPRVFWNTADHCWHAHYRDIARQFDHVFCADQREAASLRAEGVKAAVLSPAVQPGEFNPVRPAPAGTNTPGQLLFDGIVDLLRPTAGSAVIRKLLDRGLEAMDSHCVVFANRLEDEGEAAENLRGCVTRRHRIAALRDARLLLTLRDSHLTQTEQRWRLLESAACRVPIVQLGLPDEGDPGASLVTTAADEAALLGVMAEFDADDLKRERAAHLSWREACTTHTFARRLATIGATLGLAAARAAAPPISIVTPTFRKHRLKDCVASFDRQVYPDKELVIVFNGELAAAEVDEVCADRDDIRVLAVPRERHTGACMNAGIAAARGKYCFKMDDDDLYGAHYVSDMVLHAEALDADVFGKPSRNYAFGTAPQLHRRVRSQISELCAVSARALADATVWMSGNSLSGRRDALLAAPFSETLYSAADTAFVMGLGGTDLRVAILDPLNLVTVRNEEGAAHTWNASDRLRDRLEPTAVDVEAVMA